MTGRIRVGVGGWSFDPWRETFYPPEVPKSRELDYMSRQLATIEINGTFYRTQTPATFAKWRKATPDGFVFALKATRYSTNRKVLAEAGESVGWFVRSGIVELEDRLGPINWQLAQRPQCCSCPLAELSQSTAAASHAASSRLPSPSAPCSRIA